MSIKLVKIKNLLKKVNENDDGIFSRKPKPIVVITGHISNIIGDNVIYLSEFVIAKIKGKIPELNGHPEITDKIIISLPVFIQYPMLILKDTRVYNKYLFIIDNSFMEIVIEVKRTESNKTEVNTLHKINHEELKRLEHKFPVIL